MSASAHPTEQVGQTPLHCHALKGRGAVIDVRLPPRGRDQPQRRRGRPTTHRGTSNRGITSGAPRLLAATLVAIAVLTLTACEDGKGLRDEGPSTPTSPTATASDGR
ncbi:hypothetical protein ACIBU0_19665 [Streptomyces sp. NPDC049627]|uniref:hypothetical protein n=1 Tax=Streptomyces sp. NPDC049627 TaxID=3365595 RepID=UPI0037915440